MQKLVSLYKYSVPGSRSGLYEQHLQPKHPLLDTKWSHFRLKVSRPESFTSDQSWQQPHVMAIKLSATLMTTIIHTLTSFRGLTDGCYVWLSSDSF